MNAFIARPTSRTALKEETRVRILEVAKKRLEDVGFEATSIRDVAREANVAAGTVLLHFQDKTQLLHAAFFDDLAATWAAARALPSTGALVPDLCAIADAFFAYYAARPQLSRVLLRESLFAAPPWQQRFVAQLGEVQARIAELVSGVPGLDPAVFGASWFSFYYFALLAWAQGGHPAPGRLFERMLAQHLAPYLRV